MRNQTRALVQRSGFVTGQREVAEASRPLVPASAWEPSGWTLAQYALLALASASVLAFTAGYAVGYWQGRRKPSPATRGPAAPPRREIRDPLSPVNEGFELPIPEHHGTPPRRGRRRGPRP